MDLFLLKFELLIKFEVLIKLELLIKLKVLIKLELYLYTIINIRILFFLYRRILKIYFIFLGHSNFLYLHKYH